MTQPTDPRTVIAREPATGPHPHPSQKRRVVEISGVDRVLLGDDTELYECTRGSAESPCSREGKYDGPFRSPNLQSVVAHTGRHTTARPGTEYDDATLRVVIRTVSQVKGRPRTASGRRSVFQEAADELNRRGITTARGRPWLAKTVNSVYLAWRDAYPSQARVRRARTVTPVGPVADTAVAVTRGAPPPGRSPSVSALSKHLTELAGAARHYGQLMTNLATELDRVCADVTQLRVVDPRAAEQLSQLQSALRGLVG